MNLPSPSQLNEMNAEQLQALLKHIQSAGPIATFPWHKQQRAALRAATNAVVVLGGNQSGKTTVGRGIVSRLVRREGPIYRRLRKPEGRKLKIWVSPQTFEKYKSNWETQLLNEVFGDMNVDYVQTPIPKFTWSDDHGGGELWGKSQDQGFMAFESDVVDLIVFDEEPADRRIYTSSIARLSTTNGVIAFAFTPLLGLSWTYSEFFLPAKRRGVVLGDRVWRLGNAVTLIQMGMADNPEAVAGGGVARIRDNPAISEAEKNTRLFGEYGFTEGLIWQQLAGLNAEEDSPYLVNELPGSRSYQWLMTVDPNKRHGALLSALDHEGFLWVVGEHYAEGLPDRVHAQHLNAMAKVWRVPMEQVDVYADPGGAGAQAIINLADVGINAGKVPKGEGSVKASIELVRRALSIHKTATHPITGKAGTPKLFFLRDLRSHWKLDGVDYDESRLLWELRQYRQKPDAAPDTPIKEKDDLVDCLRYAYLVRAQEPTLPADDSEKRQRAKLDRLSRKASEEFDALVERMKSGRSGRRYVDSTLGRL